MRKENMIEIEEARGLLARAVLTQPPGFRYTDSRAVCVYRVMSASETGNADDPRCKTGCLIGTALTLAGETRHLDSVHDGNNVADLAGYFPELMSDQTVEYFHIAQIAQDKNSTWLQAYERAEQSLAAVTH